MGPWKTLPLDLPTDGEDVWVRLNYWFGAPFLATWDAGSMTFKEVSSPLGMQYPFWTISRWASQ